MQLLAASQLLSWKLLSYVCPHRSACLYRWPCCTHGSGRAAPERSISLFDLDSIEESIRINEVTDRHLVVFQLLTVNHNYVKSST